MKIQVPTRCWLQRLTSFIYSNVLQGCCFLFFVLPFFSSCKTETEDSKRVSYLRHVGDIPFDARYDDPAFKPCHEDLAAQYYGFGKGLQYQGEKAAVIRIFQNKYEKGSATNESGYITIRFIVNCKGETGRFRMQQMDQNYDDKVFSETISKQIMDITQSLDGWNPGEYQDRTYDYYQHLTFKIIDSEIASIIP